MATRISSPTRNPVGDAKQNIARPVHRILVVDDEPLICRLGAEVLMDAGYRVDTAEDGEIAWCTLQFKNYSLLITDNEMPNVTGLELLIRMRAARLLLPTIMVSATLPHEELRQNLWLQPIVTLSKPYHIEELLGTVQAVLCARPFSDEPPAPTPVHKKQSLRYHSLE